jgi:hypothetical protein
MSLPEIDLREYLARIDEEEKREEYISRREAELRREFIESFSDSSKNGQFDLIEEYGTTIYDLTQDLSVEIVDWLAFGDMKDAQMAELIADKLDFRAAVEKEIEGFDDTDD